MRHVDFEADLEPYAVVFRFARPFDQLEAPTVIHVELHVVGPCVAIRFAEKLTPEPTLRIEILDNDTHPCGPSQQSSPGHSSSSRSSILACWPTGRCRACSRATCSGGRHSWSNKMTEDISGRPISRFGTLAPSKSAGESLITACHE